MTQYYWLVRGKARNLQGEVFVHVARIMAATAGDAMDAAIGDVLGQQRISWWVDEPTAINEGEVKEPAPLLQSEATPEALAAACLAHGFDLDDARALAEAIERQEVRASLAKIQGGGAEDGQQFWLVEQIGAWPPMNWTLPLWRARRHTLPCGDCHHHSEDPITTCPCLCHTITAGIIDSEL